MTRRSFLEKTAMVLGATVMPLCIDWKMLAGKKEIYADVEGSWC